MSRERFIISNLLNLIVSFITIILFHSFLDSTSITKSIIIILVILIITMIIGYSVNIQNNIIAEIGFKIWKKKI